jgi:hypothetical protein
MTDHNITISEASDTDDDVAVTIDEVPVDDYNSDEDGDDSTPPEDRKE